MLKASFNLWIFLILSVASSIPAAQTKQAKLWEPVEWQFKNPAHAGNPFDLVAEATFTHEVTGKKIRTELFYDTGNVWKLRFTGTKTGQWQFKTESSDPDLNGLKGKIEILPNPGVPGFITNFGSKWGRLGTNQAFVPQLAMYCDPDDWAKNPDRIDTDIREFVVEHGFNGFHVAVLCRWFDFEKTRSNEITTADPNPDPQTFEVLELLLKKVQAAGGIVHIWAWGDEQRRMTPHKWGLNGKVDRRLQRYICARLGPLPGWSMGYGFDLQEWVKKDDLRTWHKYMHEHLGWPHYLGGRAPDLEQIYDGLDYSSYQQHRPNYDTYVKAIEQFPDKPTFLEDRFRVRKGVYPEKDYDFEMTRRGLWHSTMAGGAANIWGNLLDPRPDGMTHPYPNRRQVKTWSLFWKDRFEKEMIRDNSLTDGVCLKVPGKLLVFYKENADSIRIDLDELSGGFRAVAVDTKAKYKEIELTDLKSEQNQSPKIPHRSDWAIAAEIVTNPNNQYGRTELLRDKWGVPHIFSATDTGAMYALGYAAAEDRAFQMYYNLRIIQGRLAELIGDQKVGATRRLPQGKNSALRNDIKMRTMGYFRAAQEVAKNLDPETKALLRAYSKGVNDSLANNQDDLLYLFDKLNLKPEPWTPAACIASWWRLGIFFSGDGLRDMNAYYDIKDGIRKVRSVAPDNAAAVLRARPIRDDAAVIQRTDVSDEWVEKLHQYAENHKLTRKIDSTPMRRRPPPARRFSHAWAAKTTDGSAALVSDPQTPVRNPSLLYEFHIFGETFNARGVGVAGSPIILIGFTDQVSWGLTALGADQADLFVLKTEPNHPNQYLFDGKWRDMEIRTETVKVKDGRDKTLTLRETHLGPVVTSIAMGVRRGDQVALKRIPNCRTDSETIQSAIEMMRAKDARQFSNALGLWQFPSANCVFADTKGNIGYKTILALPVRSVKAPLDGMAAHDGSTSKADWQGILPHELLPQVINPKNNWIVTANHRPIASFYPISMGISTGSLGDTDRSWRLKERVKAKRTFTPQDVFDIHFDTVNPIKRHLVRFGYYLRDVQKYPLEEETLLALRYVEDWYAAGAKLEMSIKGSDILNLMPMAFRQNFVAATVYGGGLSGLTNMLQTIEARIAEDPKARLTPDEADYVNLILRAAWRYGKANYGNDPNKWHTLAKEKLIQSKLGYFATLDGFASLDPEKDVAYPPLTCIDGGTILSQKAQSYTQFVPMSDPDNAKALLPIGPAEQPENQHRMSDYRLWAEKKLRPAPLSREKLEPFIVARKRF
ncbi:MAG: penicillin acylase family protein [Planctomycetota bacterium]|jgi:penicillin amidase